MIADRPRSDPIATLSAVPSRSTITPPIPISAPTCAMRINLMTILAIAWLFDCGEYSVTFAAIAAADGRYPISATLIDPSSNCTIPDAATICPLRAIDRPAARYNSSSFFSCTRQLVFYCSHIVICYLAVKSTRIIPSTLCVFEFKKL